MSVSFIKELNNSTVITKFLEQKIEVVHKLDVQGLPDSNQVYKIPPNFACIPESSHHDRAIYSMWSHFVEKCRSTDLHTGVDSVKRNNRYLGSANRLPIFYNLSNATSLDGKDSPAEESFIRNPQSNRLSLNVHGEEQVRQVHQQNRSVTLQEASPMSVSELFSSHPGLELRPNFSPRPYYEGGRHSPCAYRSNEYEDFDHSGDRVPSQVHQHCYTTQKPSSRTSNNRLSERQSAPNASMRSNSHFHPYTPSFNEFDGRTAPYYENTIHRGDASVRHSPYREHEHQYCSPQYSPLSVGGRYQGGNSGYPSPTSSLDHYQQHAASPYRLDSSDNTRQHYQFYDQQDQQQQSTAQPSHFQQPLSPASYAHFMEPSPLPCALRRSTSSEIGEVIPNTLSPCGAQNTFLSQQENIALGAVFDTWNDLQWCGDDVELVSIASADSHGSSASGSGADGGADIWNLQLVEPQECNDNSVNSADPTQHGDDIVQLDPFPWVHSQDTGY